MIAPLTHSEYARNEQQAATFGKVRKQLGEMTALALEILVVSAVLESRTKRTAEFTWNALGKLIAIVVFRAGLSYCLGTEIHEIEQNIERERKYVLHQVPSAI